VIILENDNKTIFGGIKGNGVFANSSSDLNRSIDAIYNDGIFNIIL